MYLYFTNNLLNKDRSDAELPRMRGNGPDATWSSPTLSIGFGMRSDTGAGIGTGHALAPGNPVATQPEDHDPSRARPVVVAPLHPIGTRASRLLDFMRPALSSLRWETPSSAMASPWP